MRLSILILSFMSIFLLIGTIFDDKKIKWQSEEIKTLTNQVDSLRFKIYFDSVGRASEQYFKKQLGL